MMLATDQSESRLEEILPALSIGRNKGPSPIPAVSIHWRTAATGFRLSPAGMAIGLRRADDPKAGVELLLA
jgi:hypothetical protein